MRNFFIGLGVALGVALGVSVTSAQVPEMPAAPTCCPWGYVVYPVGDPVLLDALYTFNTEGRPYELAVDNGQAYLYYQVHGEDPTRK